MLLGAGAMTYLTQLTVSSSYASVVLPALLILGLGFGMIFAPAINTATAGVPREDSGVASALVNTMQQVGGSIGTATLSTIALTATSYLAAHRALALRRRSRPPRYTVAFAVSAGIFALGVILAIVLLPSRQRLQTRAAAAAPAPAASPAPAPAVAPAPPPPPRPPPRRTPLPPPTSAAARGARDSRDSGGPALLLAGDKSPLRSRRAARQLSRR